MEKPIEDLTLKQFLINELHCTETESPSKLLIPFSEGESDEVAVLNELNDKIGLERTKIILNTDSSFEKVFLCIKRYYEKLGVPLKILLFP
jgi:hypothetical protein